jgi:polyisoprenoid-binding protein YceI
MKKPEISNNSVKNSTGMSNTRHLLGSRRMRPHSSGIPWPIALNQIDCTPWHSIPEIVYCSSLAQQIQEAENMQKMYRTILISLVFISAASNAAETTVAFAGLPGGGKYHEEHPVTEKLNSMPRQNTFEIVQQSSNLRFNVDSPIGVIWFNIDDFEGNFSISNNESHSNIAAIDVNARSLDSDRGFVAMILRGEEFLNVDNFPHMHFVGRSIEWYGGKYAVLKGNMTIKNTTREVSFYVELIGSEIGRIESDRITLKATTTIKRSEFGIYTLIPLVSDSVNLYISMEAVKQKSPISIASSRQTVDLE